MQVLLVLAEHAGEVVTREVLEGRVWSGRAVSHDAVTNSIAKLRRALGDDRRRPRFIETIPKRGYRLMPQPTPLPADPVTSSRAHRPWAGKTFWILAAALVITVGIGLWFWFPPAAEQPPNRIPNISVAVLPLTDMSGLEDRYFIDGLTHDIIEELGRQRQLSVVSPTTVFSYRDALGSDQSLGDELGARFLVRGEISQDEETIAMNLRMIDTEGGRELWAARFTGTNKQIFSIKEQIVGGILS